jgi:hypothetical protein
LAGCCATWVRSSPMSALRAHIEPISNRTTPHSLSPHVGDSTKWRLIHCELPIFFYHPPHPLTPIQSLKLILSY